MIECGTCHRVRGYVTKTLDNLGLPLNRVILANRAGKINGKTQVTFTVKVVKDGTVRCLDPKGYPEGWPNKNQAAMYALEMASAMGLMSTTEFMSPQRMAANLAVYG